MSRHPSSQLLTIMEYIPKNKKLILFDGVCNLCNHSVQFIITHDKNNVFMFAPLQGTTGAALVKTLNIDTKKLDSILLYTPKKGVKSKSTAALKIASKLRFPINVLYIFIIVPPFIRNWIYNIIAKNRYRWFGKKETCMIPTAELENKFLP